MRLTIIVPGKSDTPSGGRRVHYEYANRLAARGHAVTVIAWVPSRRVRFGLRRRGLRRSLRMGWFDFDPRVGLSITSGRSIPRCDVAIVTSWSTAEMVPSIRGRVHGVVQIAYDYEYWMVAARATRSRMALAFTHPDVVIATSRAVKTMLKEAGRDPDAVIPCGLDLNAFHVVRDTAEREPVVGFVARPGRIKRCEDAIAALGQVRERRGIRVVAVGPGRIELPQWVETINAPTDDVMRSFYNELAIFLLPSEYEGWGLPAAEAMACGAAVISSRNGGVEDFAEDGINALLVPPGDPDSLAEACVRLLDDDATRIRIADAGARTARTMDWGPSVNALEEILESFQI